MIGYFAIQKSFNKIKTTFLNEVKYKQAFGQMLRVTD